MLVSCPTARRRRRRPAVVHRRGSGIVSAGVLCVQLDVHGLHGGPGPRPGRLLRVQVRPFVMLLVLFESN